MKIIRNSAKCDACGVEIESKHVHDFRVHYCEVVPKPAVKWEGDKLMEVPGKTTWTFAVDGGRSYLKRCGEGFTETSEVTEE